MASAAKVALITGGASGIGLAVVVRLLESGWNCTILDFNLQHLEEAKQKLGPQVLFIKCNVANYDEQSRAFVQSWEKWRRLDFVFANAGIGDRIDWLQPAKELPNGSPEKPDMMVVDICLTGAAYSSYLGLHYFRKYSSPGGKIVFTSSQAGLYPHGRGTMYTAAKHAIVGLTRSMGKRLGSDTIPITANCVCPGAVITNIRADAVNQATPPEHETPISTVVRAVEQCLEDDSFQGRVLECSGGNIHNVPIREYPDETTKALWSGGHRDKIDQELLAKQMAEKRAIIARNLVH
ncbi:hypothetical protein NA57DRAFT_62338 [Rhizodiscina lignyota]|uniref:15-hydroxyprostaglandin dehydrogenase n=1 Tax=Rhizodiscina lignyota TaxID=1504668 RepID=A0A9P4I350_9PEZI|nr:hypothetical protein NA57DRAFT_62338 [Rhizodiscina lignyota]